MLDGTRGPYPWDEWERAALAQGLPEPLAALGRAVMRQAHERPWAGWLQAHCGWSDGGRQMLRLASQSQGVAQRRWRCLLETDGLSGDYDPNTGQWSWGYLRPEAQRLLSIL